MMPPDNGSIITQLMEDLRRIEGHVEAIDQIRSGVAALVHNQAQFAEALTLMVDIREMVNDNVAAMHTELAVISRQVQILEAPLGIPEPTGWRRVVRRWGPWLGGGLLGVGMVSGVWWTQPVSRFQGLAQEVHTVLEQHYTQVPKSMHDQLREVYGKYGFQEPTASQAKGR